MWSQLFVLKKRRLSLKLEHGLSQEMKLMQQQKFELRSKLAPAVQSMINVRRSQAQ